MSEKIAKTICRYAQDRGYDYLRLEKQGASLVCACGHGHKTDYLRLDEKTELSIADTFRRLVGAAENDLFSDKRFKIADKRSIISGRATLLPAAEGEKLIITLSSEKPSVRRLTALGLDRPQLNVLKQSLKKKSGVILVAAPDENGASSTYYSLLAAAADNGRSTYSIETYPQQNIENVSVIVPPKYSGVNNVIERLLKTDSELIGIDAALTENDLKTIWRAAGTGRLIIAVIRAKTAAETLNILKKSGLSGQEIASQLILINVQKLFLRPCPRCLQTFDPGSGLKQTITQRWPLAAKHWPKKLYRNKGCVACNRRPADTKTAVFEQMRFLADGRLQAGYQPLIIDALAKAGLGLIQIEDLAAWALADKKI